MEEEDDAIGAVGGCQPASPSRRTKEEEQCQEEPCVRGERED